MNNMYGQPPAPLGVEFWKHKLHQERIMHAELVHQKDVIIRDLTNRNRFLEAELNETKAVNKYMDLKLFPPEKPTRTAATYGPPATAVVPTSSTYDPATSNNGQGDHVGHNGYNGGHQDSRQEPRPSRVWTPGQPTNVQQTNGQQHHSSAASSMTPSPPTRDYRNQDEDDEEYIPPPRCEVRSGLTEEERRQLGRDYDGYHGDRNNNQDDGDEEIHFGDEDDEVDEQINEQNEQVEEPRPKAPAKRGRPKSNANRTKKSSPPAKKAKGSNGKAVKKPAAKKSKETVARKSTRRPSNQQEPETEEEVREPPQLEIAMDETPNSSVRKRKPPKRFESPKPSNGPKKVAQKKKQKTSETEPEVEQEEEEKSSEDAETEVAICVRENDGLSAEPEEEEEGDDGTADDDEEVESDYVHVMESWDPNGVIMKKDTVKDSIREQVYKCVHKRCIGLTRYDYRGARSHAKRHVKDAKHPFQCQHCDLGYETQDKMDVHLPKCRLNPANAGDHGEVVGDEEEENDVAVSPAV